MKNNNVNMNNKIKDFCIIYLSIAPEKKQLVIGMKCNYTLPVYPTKCELEKSVVAELMHNPKMK